jgi:hypothetical protein
MRQALAIPVQPVVQEQQNDNPKHHHYELTDMDTFGGSASNGIPTLNNRGIAIPGPATSVPALPPATALAAKDSMGWSHSSPMAFEPQPPLGLDCNGGSID